MKTNSNTLIISLLLGATSIISSCQKDNIRPMDVYSKPVLQTPPERTANIDFKTNFVSHKWHISLFDDGYIQMKTNQTALFRDYVFEFNDRQVILASGKERNVSGKWNVYYENGVQKVVIDFGWTPFTRLNSKWEIDSYNQYTTYLRSPRGMGDAILRLEVGPDLTSTVMEK